LTPIQTARFDADNILTKLEGWTDDEVNASNPGRRTELIATAAAYAGYAYLLLGEGFCSATVDAGPELTQAEVLGLAEERFTRALAAADQAGDDDIRNLALVGRARARLDQGKTPRR
jgi:hypothetical protein